MKRLFLTTAASIPLVLASVTYAQSTTPPATDKTVTETREKAPAPAAGSMPKAASDAAVGAPAAPMAAPDTRNDKETVRGWSVKDKIMGKNVYNENDEKVGDVTDVVLTSDGKAAYFVIGAGGFLGMGQHDVAIPFDKIQQSGDRLTLRGYTKDQLKALPQVELAK